MTTLPWLPAPNAEIKAQLASALADKSRPDIVALCRIASFDWSEAELRSIGKALRVYSAEESSKAEFLRAGLSLNRVLVLSSSTFLHLSDALIGVGLRHGVVVVPDVVEYEDPLLWLASFEPKFRYDFALIAQDSRSLRLDSNIGNAVDVRFQDDLIERTSQLVGGLTSAVASKVILQTVVEDIASPSANIDIGIRGSHRRQVLEHNVRLGAMSVDSGALIYDVAALASFVGLSRWWPGRLKHAAKLPFAMPIVPAYLDGLVRIVAASSGKSRRVLVLDLDNTLWGGVIGDDGLEGIKVGQGSAVGEAHTAIQIWAQSLKKRGVVLCVASKNTHDVAIEAFRSHPDMVLQERDIALFRINWLDKAANIQEIAQALNLGLDTFVFVDDNPAERKRIRDAYPMVAVPELPVDPSDWPLVLNAAGYFEQTALTDEDVGRSDYYIADARRGEARAGAVDEATFLQSMEMEIAVARFDSIGRKRIAQLVSKSNQFNLTTKRYSEAEIAALENDENVLCLQVRLKDIFGDNGMISAVVAKFEGASLIVDAWVMSCRVIGRKVEEAILMVLAERARGRKAKTIVGHYLPTARNGLVRDHYANLGFQKVRVGEGGRSEWSLDVDAYSAPTLPFAKILVDEGSRVVA